MSIPEAMVLQVDRDAAEKWDFLLNHFYSEYEGDAVADLASDFAAHRQNALTAAGVAEMRPWPDVLTPELSDILGRQCFMFIKLAQVYRAAGFDIPTQAEAEQAFFLHRFLGHWFRHGDGWKEAAETDLRETHEAALQGSSHE